MEPSNKGPSSAHVLSIITSRKCGIFGNVNITKPLKDTFPGATSACFWISCVSGEFPNIPEKKLSVSPDETFSSVAQRISDYLNQ